MLAASGGLFLSITQNKPARDSGWRVTLTPNENRYSALAGTWRVYFARRKSSPGQSGDVCLGGFRAQTVRDRTSDGIWGYPDFGRLFFFFVPNRVNERKPTKKKKKGRRKAKYVSSARAKGVTRTTEFPVRSLWSRWTPLCCATTYTTV